MVVAGCDVGSLTAKAVILADNKVRGYSVIPALNDPKKSAENVMAQAKEMAGLKNGDLAYCIGTGYGRKKMDFANEVISEIVAHGKAINWLLPEVRTIIDVGGQDAKAIRISEKGDVDRYNYNDKCASGTGRFLEVMSLALEIPLEELGELSLTSKKPIKISNQCTVFAETEVVSQMNNGANTADIVAGLHQAMAHRVASLAKSIEVTKGVAMSGGVAKNCGMYRALEEALGIKMIKLETDPQLNGALGAAIIAAQVKGAN